MNDEFLIEEEGIDATYAYANPVERHKKTKQLVPTDRTIKDRKIIENMMKQNEELYSHVERTLDILLNGNSRKPDVLSFARKIASENGLKIERLMKRSKQALICWFCKHHELVPHMTNIINALKANLPFSEIVKISKSRSLGSTNLQGNDASSSNDDESFEFFEIFDEPIF